MTSLEEAWAEFQKHNSKKRVIKKASHCLCHLVSIGRKRDQLCTANCLTWKLYYNKLHPGGKRLRPHHGPWPSNQAQSSWANEVGTKAGRQSASAAVARQWWLQRRCKTFTGMWSLEKGSAWNVEDKITCERIFCEGVMPWRDLEGGLCSETKNKNHMELFSKLKQRCPSFENSCCDWLHGITASENILSHVSFLILPSPFQAVSVSRTHMPANLLGSPLNLLLACNCCWCILPPIFRSHFICSGAVCLAAGPGARVGP